MSAFSTFVIFYMTAFLWEMVEDWEYSGFTVAFFVLIAFFVFTRITRLKFLIFLILTTAYLLIFRFPEVANHVNFIIYSNVALMVGLIYSLLRPQSSANGSRLAQTESGYYELIRPIIGISVCLLYFLAGFHKLNRDFFHPHVSCAGGMLYGIISMLESRVLGVPTSLLLAIAIFIVAWQLLKGSQALKSRIFVLALLAIALATPLILYVTANAEFLRTLKTGVVISTGVMVILWELIGGLLLAFPLLQAPVLLFSWTTHSVLAMIGFVDFGALIFSLFLAFVPASYYQLLNSSVKIPPLKLSIHRTYVYFLLNALGGIITGIHFIFYPVFNIKAISGIIFNLSSIIFVWPILSLVFLPAQRPIWSGIPLLNRNPKFMLVFPLLLFLYGITPYLGLRTAGNFSMFSNLRTEGEYSNHLLLKSNPLKIWGYQEDAVQFIEIDDERAELGHKYRPLKGNLLPVVEFRKLIYKWTEAEYEVPLTFKYQGTVYSTADITKDPQWRTDKQDWEMRLMDFRVIEPDSSEVNHCQW